MYKNLWLLVSILFFSLLVGCGTNQTTENEKQTGTKKSIDIPFERFELIETPEDIQTAIQFKLHEEATFVLPDGDDIFIVITRGEQPTGGYTVDITNIEDNGDFISVLYELKDPTKDEIVSQAITYPHAIVKTKRLDKQIKFRLVEHHNKRNKGFDINL